MHESNYITMHQAAKLVPGGTSANAVWRWCRRGVLARTGKRVNLQHVRIGGKLYTSAAWLAEFGKFLAEADANYFNIPDTRPIAAFQHQTDQQHSATVERAMRGLKEMGV